MTNDSSHNSTNSTTPPFFTSFQSLAIYGALGLTQGAHSIFARVHAARTAIVAGLATLVQMYGSRRCSERMHNTLLHRMMRAPMSFFDVTPTGRILNRMGKVHGDQ